MKPQNTELAIEKLTNLGNNFKRLYSISTISCPMQVVEGKKYRLVTTQVIANKLNETREQILKDVEDLKKIDSPIDRSDLDYMLSLATDFCSVPFVPYKKQLLSLT